MKITNKMLGWAAVVYKYFDKDINDCDGANCDMCKKEAGAENDPLGCPAWNFMRFHGYSLSGDSRGYLSIHTREFGGKKRFPSAIAYWFEKNVIEDDPDILYSI